MCSELGTRLLNLLQKKKSLDAASYIDFENLNEFTFKQFSYTHADVMGSGRFFYIDAINELNIELPKADEK